MRILKRKAFLPLLAVLCLLTGCRGAGGENSTVNRGLQETEQQEAEQPETETGQQKNDPQKTKPREAEASYPRELTREELKEFTIWLNKGSNYGNYGFLLSAYVNPRDADPNEILYAGAGMDCAPLSQEEEQAFLEAVGQEELYTDYTRLTTAQIDGFLQEKLGVKLEEMTRLLLWTYLPEFDIWVMEHGDTNYMNFTCVSGRQTGEEVYELDCVPGDENYTPLQPSCRVTLKAQEGGYRFLSNIYVKGLSYSKAIWKMEEQSFSGVELEGWGKVDFVSYGPDISAYGNRDVTFELEWDGKTLYSFPPVEEDNYRRESYFADLLAVSFQDYDGDGNKDVIVLARYKDAIGAGDVHREVRLYRNYPQEKEFVLDFDKMDELNANQWNHTVAEVMKHAGPAAEK